MTSNLTDDNQTLSEKKPSIYSLRLDELKDWLQENGEKAFRATQIFEWLYEKRVKTFEEMSNMSK